MFEYSLVPCGKANPWPLAVACLSEAIVLTGLAVIPLLFVDTLPEPALFNALMLPPVPTAPPSPPPPMVAAKPVHRTARAPRMFNPDALVSPAVVPKAVAIINDTAPPEVDIMAGGVPGGIPGMAGIGGGIGLFGNASSVAPPPPPPPLKILAPTTPPPAVTPMQVSVGGDVQAALLLQRIEPIYPNLAQLGRIRGNVVLRAVIGTDGQIKNLTVVSGHPLLVQAAVRAVRQWLYRPTFLNGAPVEVITEIVVRFKLTSLRDRPSARAAWSKR
ncbi:MAG TPA: TonB family protein [Bryobacteraceae bacterium]|nr:TonB family protein [Bryobacteraceae bacterium]